MKTITITEKGKEALPRILELARQGYTAAEAFAKAEAEYAARHPATPPTKQ